MSDIFSISALDLKQDSFVKEERIQILNNLLRKYSIIDMDSRFMIYIAYDEIFKSIAEETSIPIDKVVIFIVYPSSAAKSNVIFLEGNVVPSPSTG